MKFVTKKGWLTRYALACGYVEVNEEKDIRFYLDGCFHVTGYGRLFWESFDEYEPARKFFVEMLKKYNKKRIINQP